MVDIKTEDLRIDQVVSCNLLDDIFYQDIISQSKVLKSTISKGMSTLTSFDLLSYDIFNLLYKIVITFNDDSILSPTSFQNKPIIEYLYNSTIVNKLRNRTKGSLPNTAISIKYILDEIISRLRGSKESKSLRSQQEELLHLHRKKEELKKIADNLIKYNESNELMHRFNCNGFPFKENIQFLLEEILQRGIITNQNYSLIDLLDTILSKSREAISKDNLFDGLSKSDSNLLLTTSIINAIKTLKGNTLESKIYDFEDMFELFLNKINHELRKDFKKGANDIDCDFREYEKDSLMSYDYENNISDKDQIFLETFENTLDYIEQKLWSYKKNSYVMMEEIIPSLGKLDFFLESKTKDIDDTVIVDNLSNVLNNFENQIYLIGEMDNPIPKDFSRDKPRIFNRYAQHNHVNELISFISNAIKSIDMKIDFSKNSMKKQLENINFDKVINESINYIIDFNKNMELLNVNNNSISKLSFDEIISLSKYFNNAGMKIFLDKVGRKKEIALRASLKHKRDKNIVTDKILFSNDIDNIIDEELMMFSLDIEAFKSDFYNRYLHNRLLTYEKVRSKEKNKGPIILCYDGSGSMDGNKIKETKVHIISFIEVARIQRRKLVTIQFASKDEPLIIKELNPNNISIGDIYDIMNDFIRGGTDFEKPLKKAIDFIKVDRFKHADIMFITDGICSISEDFKKEFTIIKKIMKFKLYTVIMHGNTYSDFGDIGDISDEVMEIRSINLNEWNDRISEKIFSICGG